MSGLVNRPHTAPSSHRVSRRGFLAGGVVLVASSVLPRPTVTLAQTEPPQATESVFEHLFYGGNGTVPVDSGLPNVGVFYGVKRSTGDLLWYQYSGGNGGGLQPNSANPIGNGWSGCSHILGCGNGVILAIRESGEMYWYQYLGNGEANRSANTGWHQNSGNQIGTGWGDAVHVFVNPAEGRDPGFLQIYAITSDGSLRWFSYGGEGEPDSTGTAGWHPNSGNQIGNGWDSVQHVTGIGGAIFVVRDDGGLYWYLYQGGGASDPSAATGWRPNSGNQIGNGWGGVQHLFGGNTGSYQSVFVVDQYARLMWYGYDGTGEHDPSGNTGWLDGSGYSAEPNF